MQRLSNTALSVALTVFIMATSLALIAASWLIATYLLNGPIRPSLLKGLFMGLLIIGFSEANAQPSTSDTYDIGGAYSRQPNHQQAIPLITVTTLDTLRPPVQVNVRHQKRRISPKPAWTMDKSSVTDYPSEPDPSSVFYIMAAEPNPSAYKAGYWFRSRP